MDPPRQEVKMPYSVVKRPNQDLPIKKKRSLFPLKKEPQPGSNVNVTVANLYQTINYGVPQQQIRKIINTRSVENIRSILNTPIESRNRKLSAEVLKHSL